MVTAALVDRDIKDGEILVRQLDDDEFHVTAALWYYRSEYEKWGLLIGSPTVGKHGPLEAYRRLIVTIKRIKKKSGKRGFSLDSSRVELVKDNDVLLRSLRQATKTGRSIAGKRYTNSTINGTFIEDAYIYRVS